MWTMALTQTKKIGKNTDIPSEQEAQWREIQALSSKYLLKSSQ